MLARAPGPIPSMSFGSPRPGSNLQTQSSSSTAIATSVSPLPLHFGVIEWGAGAGGLVESGLFERLAQGLGEASQVASQWAWGYLKFPTQVLATVTGVAVGTGTLLKLRERQGNRASEKELEILRSERE